MAEHRSRSTQSPPRVVTLTPAPAVDRVYVSDGIVPGVVNRVSYQNSLLAGKGLNIAHGLSLVSPHVKAVVALGPIDGAPAHRGWWPDLADGVVEVVDVRRPVRQNSIITTVDGHTTNLNEEPAALDPAEWAATVDRTLAMIEHIKADRLVIGGALPRAADTGGSVDLVPLLEQARARGALIAIDMSGTALSRYARHPLVDIIKPNLSELQQIALEPLRTFGDVVAAARAVIRHHGAPLTVVVSLGEDGLLGVRADAVSWAPALTVAVANTTGAGDAALAGVLSVIDREPSTEHPLDKAIALGATWGSLAVAHPTSRPPHLPAEPLVSVHPIDLDRELSVHRGAAARSGLTGVHA
ncbi:1-phosphofructokinase family hexose kinase [Subtercola lobariae]|uniref:1-phosphofructokinase n=1 Tax=Subtercola lobariae TaxID=1588641 RepID=A0A917EZ75_9MICO|nr:PfkB family carbohydrate kinase [Subtercola lobariae]GGF36213.1 1-phosphofructokinase [Subtercola lobariae]